jgi:hypothetical protein
MPLIETDINGVPMEAVLSGVTPVYFNEANRPSPESYLPNIQHLSRQCWSYLGYEGLIRPWHDGDQGTIIFKKQKESFRQFFYEVKKLDINLDTYLFLLFLTSKYEMWERPTLLMLQPPAKSWFRKLRAHAGSSEMVDRVYDFIKEFVVIQAELSNKYTISKTAWLEVDPKSVLEVQQADKRRRDRIQAGDTVRDRKMDKAPSKYFGLFHRIVDRIRYLEHHRINCSDWMRMKFQKCLSAGFMETIQLATIVNVNAMDPELSKVFARLADPWRSVKEFLKLPANCVFPDNCIPKGWRPASEDGEDSSKIARVGAEGYYQYADGTQRRGRRHYATNKYLVILCTPDNFPAFRGSWDDVRRLSGRPSWEEYANWGMFKDIWDKEGNSLRHGIDSITWRKS